jgi:outer membrane receptor protein involved in Fe transport
MRKPTLRIGSAALALVAGLAATHASAQDRQAAGAQENERGDEIIVTAQKREENLQDVPVSISVVEGEELVKSGSSQLIDFAPYVPGFAVTNLGTPGQSRLALRGIAPLGSAASVGIYLDDAPIGSSTPFNNGAIFGMDMLPYDLERVEVLRGPQGTLYGASSIGGLLKYVTVAPDLDIVSGRVGGELFAIDHASDAGYAAQGFVNVPIVAGQMAVTGSLAFRSTPGWADNVTTGEEDTNSYEQLSGRVSMLWEPSDALSLRLSGIWQDIDADGRSITVETATGGQIGNGRSNFNSVPEPFDTQFQYYSAGFDYDFGGAILSAVGTYSDTETNNALDASFVYGAALGGLVTPVYYGLTLDKYTAEVRLASPSGGRFEWLIGAFFTDEDATHDQLLRGLLPDLTPAPAPFDPVAVIALPSTYKEYALFANAKFSVTDRFDINGGVRMAWNDQTYGQIITSAVLGSAEAPGESSDKVFTYSVSPQYHFSDDTMIYARVASGYRPGGPNVVLPGTVDPETEFGADTLTNYEIGLKTSAGQVTVDLAAFRMDWKDIQVPVAVNSFGGIGNGGTARSQGVEAALFFYPVAGLTLGATAAYIDSKLTEDAPAIDGLDGARLPRIPEFSGSLTADYSFPLGRNSMASIGGGLRHTGSRFSVVESDPDALEIDSMTAIDLNASVNFGPVTLRAYARNLTNADAPLDRTLQRDALGTLSHIQVIPQQPRTLGIAADFAF